VSNPCSRGSRDRALGSRPRIRTTVVHPRPRTRHPLATEAVAELCASAVRGQELDSLRAALRSAASHVVAGRRIRSAASPATSAYAAASRKKWLPAATMTSGASEGSGYRRGGYVATACTTVASHNPNRICRAGLFLRRYFFVRARCLVAPGPGIVSISSVRRDLVPFGTIAATTGFLSTLRSCRRGGFSLR
jgi:hypothetical protein